MVDIMNELDVDCAVYGNHEFDFGIAPLQAGMTELLDESDKSTLFTLSLTHQKDAMKKMNFPWLCSNLRDIKTGEILAKTVNANGDPTGITKLVRHWNTDQEKIIRKLERVSYIDLCAQ